MNEITGLGFLCPSELSEDQKRSITRHLPTGMNIKFEIGPKITTIEYLQNLLRIVRIEYIGGEYNPHARHLRSFITAGALNLPEEGSILWSGFIQLLKKDGAVDEWELQCDDINGGSQVIRNNVKDFIPPTEEELQDFRKYSLKDTLSELIRGHKNMSDDTEKIGRPRHSKVVPHQEAKPERTTRINDDDILNLKISLETAQNVDDFLKGLE
jgi:hypothetical protein